MTKQLKKKLIIQENVPLGSLCFDEVNTLNKLNVSGREGCHMTSTRTS